MVRDAILVVVAKYNLYVVGAYGTYEVVVIFQIFSLPVVCCGFFWSISSMT